MERFPDIILINAEHTTMRLVTRRAAEWVSRYYDIPVSDILHQVIHGDEDLALDAYMSGLRLRSHTGRSIL